MSGGLVQLANVAGELCMQTDSLVGLAVPPTLATLPPYKPFLPRIMAGLCVRVNCNDARAHLRGFTLTGISCPYGDVVMSVAASYFVPRCMLVDVHFGISPALELWKVIAAMRFVPESDHSIGPSIDDLTGLMN